MPKQVRFSNRHQRAVQDVSSGNIGGGDANIPTYISIQNITAASLNPVNVTLADTNNVIGLIYDEHFDVSFTFVNPVFTAGSAITLGQFNIKTLLGLPWDIKAFARMELDVKDLVTNVFCPVVINPTSSIIGGDTLKFDVVLPELSGSVPGFTNSPNRVLVRIVGYKL